ncbi:MAG: hypothetical protein WCP24_00590 [bacterium]
MKKITRIIKVVLISLGLTSLLLSVLAFIGSFKYDPDGELLAISLTLFVLAIVLIVISFFVGNNNK